MLCVDGAREEWESIKTRAPEGPLEQMAGIVLESLVALRCSKESTGANNRESIAGEALMARAERDLRASVTIKAGRVQ